MGWWIGGVAALAGAGLGLGGSGGGSDAGGGGAPGPVPGEQGGQYGNNGQLVGAGGEANWQAGVETLVTGRARNDGRLALDAGALKVTRDGTLLNHGSLRVGANGKVLVDRDGDLVNHGQFELMGHLRVDQDGSVDNLGTFASLGGRIDVGHNSGIENLGSMTLTNTLVNLTEESEFDNGERRRNATLNVEGGGFVLRQMAEFDNHGTVTASGTLHGNALIEAVSSRFGNEHEAIEAFDNHGMIDLRADARVLSLQADSHAASGVNRHGAQIRSSAAHQGALHASGSLATLLNQGTITITGDGAVAMSGERGATLINDGTINLGEAGVQNGHGMVGMRSDGSATLNNRRGGVINIHADNSSAFAMGASGGGRLINNGTVNVYGQASGVNADAVTVAANQPGVDLGWKAPRGINGYTVGTNADGSAGRLVMHQGGALTDVQVDTGFTRGTSASQVHFDGVFVGAEGGENTIRSASVVWDAAASRDTDGTVDVTMSRKDYRDLVAEGQGAVADALEQGYQNNALFHSLEVGTASELQHAIHQLSGAGVDAANRHLLANGSAFWSSLARLPGESSATLAFGGDTVARLGVAGNGAGMRAVMPLALGQQLLLTTGLVETDAATSGQGRGVSRFAGLGLSTSVAGFQLQHTLGQDLHQLDGQRRLQWSGTDATGVSRRSVARSHFSTMVQRTLSLGAVQVTPRLGATAYRTTEAAFSESGNGFLGLSVSGGHQAGLQWEAGAGMDARAGAHWRLRADAAVFGYAAYSASERTATLGGASGQGFALPRLRASGTDYRLLMGADYGRGQLNMGASLMAERVLGQADASAQLQLGYRY